MLFKNNDLFKSLIEEDDQYKKAKTEIAKFNIENPELAQAFYDSDSDTTFISSD